MDHVWDPPELEERFSSARFFVEEGLWVLLEERGSQLDLCERSATYTLIFVGDEDDLIAIEVTAPGVLDAFGEPWRYVAVVLRLWCPHSADPHLVDLVVEEFDRVSLSMSVSKVEHGKMGYSWLLGGDSSKRWND